MHDLCCTNFSLRTLYLKSSPKDADGHPCLRIVVRIKYVNLGKSNLRAAMTNCI